MDKESKIFLKMTLGRKKCGYYVAHALYHFYFEALIKRILLSPCLHPGSGWRVFQGARPEKDDRHCHKVVLFFSILSSRFFRYWDELRGEGGEVVDEFLDLHEVGHEPADVQVKHIMDTLEKSNNAAVAMVCFS